MNILPDERHEKFLCWLLAPRAERAPRTQEELAKEVGVNPRTLRDWRMRKDFLDEYATRTRELAGDWEVVKGIYDTLANVAQDEKNPKMVAAAKLFLEAVGAIQPPTTNINVTSASDLSDAELEALIAEQAQKTAHERQQAANG
jgi:hypothetical protein